MYSSSYEDIPYSIITDIVLDEKEDLYATGKIAIKHNEETGLFLMKLRPVCDYEVLFTSIQECYLVFPHLAVDSEGNSYIASYTWDYENPVTADAFQKEKQPPNHAQSGYLMKLNAAGDEILYATYLGGSNRDWIYDIAVDKNQCVYVTGKTHSWDFPVTSNAYDTEQNLQGEAFFTVINTSSDGNAQVEVSSYFGGSGYDTGSAIQVDTEGRIYIGGTTNSHDLPTTPSAYQKVFCKNSEDQYSNDGFFCVFDSTGNTLLYSTYLGGEYSDTLHNMQLFSNNEVYLQGSTRSSDFLHPEKESSEVSNMYVLILKPFEEPVAE